MKDSASKPKVLFVLPTNTFGGAERITHNLLSGMHSFEAVLVTHEAMVPFYTPLGLTIHSFERFGCQSPDISFKNMIGYAKAIRDLSKREKPDIIFGVMHFASLFSVMAKDLFLLHPKIVASIHGNASSYYKSAGRKPTWPEKILLAYLFKRTRRFIVPSRGIKEDLIRTFKARSDRITVIYNGFDLREIRRQGEKEIPFAKDRPWITMAARFGPQKDFLTLLLAFKILREKVKLKLLLIGDGELRPTIEGWINELGLNEDVLLTGFQTNPYRYIARSDVFILSSFFEGFGSVLIEAMALGVPVVSTDCPSGPSEIIDNGKNGYLVPVSDFRQMAVSCLNILRDRELKKRLSESCVERAEAFGIKEMCEKYEKFFSSTIRERTYVG